MLDLRQLTALRAVADHGSVARAAEALGWSQPTVAHHLRALEVQLGAPIVTSSATGTRPSDAGTEMLRHARVILDRADRAHEEVREFVRASRLRLRLGIFPTAAARLLPAIVTHLHAGGFDLTIAEAEVIDLMSQIDELRLDAAIVFSAPGASRRRSDLRHEYLFSERLSVIVPDNHPTARSQRAALADFSGDDWVLGAQVDDPIESLLLSAARRSGFVPRERARSDDYRVVAAYVAAGFGVALLPELGGPAPGRGLTTVQLSDPGFFRLVELVVPPSTRDSAAQAILAATLAARRAHRGMSSE